MPRLFQTRGKSNAAAETTTQSNHINTVDGINTDSFVGTTRLCNNVTLLPIVPMKIAGKNGVTIEIFGLLDQGSEVTLIDNKVAETLNLKGKMSHMSTPFTNAIP